MDRIYELHLKLGMKLSPNRQTKQESLLEEWLHMVTGEKSGYLNLKVVFPHPWCHDKSTIEYFTDSV